jgi:hypothetical protein
VNIVAADWKDHAGGADEALGIPAAPVLPYAYAANSSEYAFEQSLQT